MQNLHHPHRAFNKFDARHLIIDAGTTLAGFGHFVSNNRNIFFVAGGVYVFMRYSFKKKAPALLLAGLMFLMPGGVAWAAFSDVPASHWAAGTITKMADSGVVGGYTDGTFKPNKTVNQVEAVCMVARAINLRSDSSTALTQLAFPVPGWAESGIRLALQHGLLKSTDQFSAYSGASRAWVARLLVRAIGKESEANEKLLMPNFTDAYKIPDWALYYVRVAQDNDLIAGYSDNSFRPDNDVSRAEMVSFLARAMNKLTGAPDSTATGSQTGTVVSGTIVKAYPEKNAFVLLNDTKNLKTYYMPGDVPVFVTGSSSSGLGALQPGDKAEVTLDTAGYVSKINVLSRSTAAENEGVVYDLDLDTALLTLQLNNDQLKPYLLDDNVSVQVAGVRFPQLQDIRKGDRVRVTIENDRVTGIELLEESAKLSVTGKVIIIDADKNILNLDVQGSLQIYRMAPGVSVSIPGMSSAFLSDIGDGDTVNARIEDGNVVALQVTGREVQDELRGTVMAVDTTNDRITLKDRQNNIKVYDILSNAKVVVNDNTARIKDIKQDTAVKFRLLDGDIIYIETDNANEGIITDLDKDRMIMVFQPENGDKKTYFINKNIDVNSEDERGGLGDIRRGDYAKIVLDGNEIKEINLRTTNIYQVVNVRDVYNRLETIDPDGDSVRLDIKNGVDLVIPGITYPNLDDVHEGDLVQATYLGNDLDQVEVLSPLRGAITSIDPASGTFSIKPFGGGTRTITFRSGDRVEIGSKVYGSISYLKVGDRVEAVEKTSNGTVIRVAEEVTGTIAADCSSSDNEVYIEKGYGWKIYNLDKNVYIHNNIGNLYSPGNLKQGMRINAFIFWNIIYEISL